MSDTDMVPRSRLNEEIAKRKEIEADHTALKATLATTEAKAAEADTLRATLAKVTADHDTFRAGVEAGITDAEGLDLARYFYDKVQPDEAGERPTFGDYMGKLKADPTARPKALGAYFSDAAQPAAPAPQATPGAPVAPTAAPAAKAAPPAAAPPPRSAAPLPGANTGATPQATPAPPATGWTAETIASLPQAQYQAHKAEIAREHSASLMQMFTGKR
jgi:hypothetical protein